MKKLIVFMFSIVLLGSCVTISRYSGEIYPANVTFERPNFKYIKTVTGSSDATFSGYGWDVKKVNGIVNEAKQNLYQQLQLKENQAPTNFTLDFVRVGEPTGKYLVLRQLKAVLTADVFEFSENGIYSGHQIVEKTEVQGVINKKIINSTSTKKETIKVNSNSPYFKYDKTPKVSDVVYFENYYTKKFEEGIVVGYVKGSSNVTLEFKNSKNKLKRKFISIDLLFQKK